MSSLFLYGFVFEIVMIVLLVFGKIHEQDLIKWEKKIVRWWKNENRTIITFSKACRDRNR